MSTEARITPERFHRLHRTAFATLLLLPLALTGCAGGESANSSPGTPGSDTAAAGGATGGTAPGTSASPGAATPGNSAAPSAPPSSAPPSASPQAPGRRLVRTAVYFLHGERVSPVPRTVRAPATAAEALRALLAGPSRTERAQGRTTAIPSGTVLRSVAVEDRVATVDLSSRYDDGGGSLSMRARVAQVVFTATRSPAVHKVRFELDGKPVTTLGGEGIVLNRPVSRADFEDLTPEILVESPMVGDTVRSPVRVWGSANTFEATFRLKVTDAAGRRAAEVLVTASSGSGARGTFDVTVPFKATRSGPGVLTAYYYSPRNGRAVVVDTVPLTVQK
ncbi:GerMN domain-containing protein [Streptomyces sp. N35]|uniref:GerMN domain-containing protein n=1 Tax=Streptomyces sp. N35 TaxID=2795730 RepID=UPI0018F5289A|nr:Gmad2 immunoglobulin-like domain-containing protein [Streptomyces sp. N35]